MAKYIMGIDCGLTNSKAVLFDLDGNEIASEARSFEVSSPKIGWVEADPERLWENAADCVKKVISKSGVDAADIGAVGATGFGNGFFGIKEDGTPACNAMGSNDGRATDTAIMLNKQPGVPEKVEKFIKSGIGSQQPATIMRWMKDNDPESYKNIRWTFQCKDYIRFKLTGQVAAEKNDMSGSALLDIDNECYSQELMDLYGIGDKFEALPPLAANSHDIVGTVSAEAAKITGLKEGTPCGAGMMDIACCALSAGIIDESYACVIAGTWSINEVIMRKSLPFLTCSLIYDVPGTFVNCTAGTTSAMNLEWFAKEFGGTAAVEAERRGVSKFDIISEAANSIPAGGTDVLYLPYIAKPNAHPYGRASFSNIAVGHTFADLARACFEGMTYDHKRYLDILVEKGADYPVVRLSGGGAKSAFWSQMFADVLNKPVEVLKVEEMGALGTAVMGAIGAGLYKSIDEALERTVEVRARFEPIAENVKAYANRYKSWYAMVETMCGAWDKGIIEQG